MEQRRLGTSELTVSAIGLGCMPLSGAYGPVSDAEGIATIRSAIELGMTLLDTADIYGHGHNEELVGRAIIGRRDRVTLATKFGVVAPDNGTPGGISGRPEYVRQACELSLRRLGVETIDLYQQHRVDPSVPIEETIGALAQLVQDGVVRHIGLSEASAADIRRAAAVHPITSVQSEYSVLQRGVEQKVLDACGDLGIGFLAFSPLMRGMLGGELRPGTAYHEADFRGLGAHPYVSSENLAANAELADVVGEIATAHNAKPGQVALSWILARRPWIVPIPGTRRAAHLAENAGAIGLELTPQEEATLDGLAARVTGSRSREIDAPGVSPPRSSP